MSTSRPDPSPIMPATPEPSTKSQVDIAADVQKGLGDSNKHNDDAPSKPTRSKATEFDGSPKPEPGDDNVFKPTDDTPSILPKRSGPKNGG
ncbi:hypothetical protein [Bordetella sp. 15P40C-2]|uniref:hypothetical protein n=1 Tax=Bordetella sp. 15P40C-2 TaxID=2572246 RepID=UPI00132B174B|nr:hypothetical protein [Bordetella sp. 15P40C-2]MVW71676.1 hypothetical protein [Bordetella sp. 15P40C-2]